MHFLKVISLVFISSINFIIAQSGSNEIEMEKYSLSKDYDFSDFKNDRILIVTNRVIDSSTTPHSFINTVSKNLQLTLLEASVSNLGQPKLLECDKSHFERKITSLENNDWLLFVHGDAKTLEQSIIRGLTIQKTYDVKVIVFSWPSKVSNKSGMRNFNNSFANVQKSTPHLESLLSTLQSIRSNGDSYFETNNLSLFCHSLGNAHIQTALENETSLLSKNTLFDNIILNAAAVSDKDHSSWLTKLNARKSIFVNSNRNDFNLKGLRIFSRYHRLLGELVKSPRAENAQYINFSQCVGFRTRTATSHTYFIGSIPVEQQSVFNYYSTIFHGGDNPTIP